MSSKTKVSTNNNQLIPNRHQKILKVNYPRTHHANRNNENRSPPSINSRMHRSEADTAPPGKSWKMQMTHEQLTFFCVVPVRKQKPHTHVNQIEQPNTTLRDTKRVLPNVNEI